MLWMSISGSALVAVYCAVCLFTRKTLSTGVRYYLLKIALVLYLVPFPAVKYLFNETMRNLTRLGSPTAYDFIGSSVVHNRQEYLVNPVVRFSLFFAAATGAIAVLFSLFHFVDYLRTKRLYRKSGWEFRVYRFYEDYSELRRELKISRNVHFVFSGYCTSPLTIGVISPVVVFPESAQEYSKDKWEFLLRHELIHIKYNDLLAKFFSLIVIAVHWFNPLSYFLFYELCNLCEIHCDDKAVEGYGREERQQYCECIIDVASGTVRKHKDASMGLAGDNVKSIRRRILEIREYKRKRPLCTALASLAAVLAWSVPVLAFEPVTEIELPHAPSSDSGYVLCDDVDQYVEFHSDDGDVFMDSETYEQPSRLNMALCRHYFVVATLGEHTRNADGSCQTIFYESERCPKCGKVIEKEYAGDAYLKKCPHQVG